MTSSFDYLGCEPRKHWCGPMQGAVGDAAAYASVPHRCFFSFVSDSRWLEPIRVDSGWIGSYRSVEIDWFRPILALNQVEIQVRIIIKIKKIKKKIKKKKKKKKKKNLKPKTITASCLFALCFPPCILISMF